MSTKIPTKKDASNLNTMDKVAINRSVSSAMPMDSRSNGTALMKHVKYEHLLAGISGGVVSTLILHPLDLLKVRFAANDGNRLVSRPQYSNMTHAFTTIWKSEGLQGLYRGVTPNVLGAGVAWGSYFLFYNAIKTWMRERNDDKEIGPVRLMVAAAEAGCLTLVITNPIWVVKTRLCLQYTGPEAEHLPSFQRYGGMADAFTKVYRHEGVAGLYKGFVPGLWGVSHGALQFVAYEDLKMRYCRFKGMPIHAKLSFEEYLTCAALSKIFAAVITYPYQVVRTRLQDHQANYEGSIDVIRTTLKHEGIRGLYKGAIPYMCHVLPSICIVFIVYEYVANRSTSAVPVLEAVSANRGSIVQSARCLQNSNSKPTSLKSSEQPKF